LPSSFEEPRTLLAAGGVKLKEDGFDLKLMALRRMYEPYVHVLASYLRFTIPPRLPVNAGETNGRPASARGTRSPAGLPDKAGMGISDAGNLTLETGIFYG
jgi:hypothetical protein